MMAAAAPLVSGMMPCLNEEKTVRSGIEAARIEPGAMPWLHRHVGNPLSNQSTAL